MSDAQKAYDATLAFGSALRMSLNFTAFTAALEGEPL
jgi:hypothetical protein